MNGRRRVLVSALAAALVGSVLALVAPATAYAHGAATAPGSRTFLCYTDGHWTGGDLDPRNAACKSAIAAGTKQPLWDWFGVLRSDGAGRTTGFIPDGQLCSGGNPKYAAYDEARNDWPATHLTSGGAFSYHYNAWAPHPGVFKLYVTKDSYDPTKPLAWSTLEATPFSTWTETTPNGNGEYFWDVTLPKNKTGRHIIYAVWSRTDSQETFYGCSDVVFDGGNGEVTGFPQDGGPTPTPTTPTPTTTTTTPPTGSCSVAVTVKPWPNGKGYRGTVAVTNLGPAGLAPWRITWLIAPGATLQSGWNAVVTQNDKRLITAKPPTWNPRLSVNETASIGFVVAGSATPPPKLVKLNGVACTAA